MQPEVFSLNFDIELRHWWFVARRRILRSLIAEVLPPSRETTIVDIGCGTGANLASLSDDYDCVGIDTSRQAIELARSRFPDVRFLCGKAPDDLGDVLARARLYLLTDVLEHVPDDFLFLSQILSAVRPGAYVLATVPADMRLWSPHDESHGHYRRYDTDRFERLWRGLPVTALLCSYFNSRLYPLVRAIRTWNRWRGHSTGAAGTDLKMGSPLVNRMLDRIFSGEGRILRDTMAGRRTRGYRAGVSLLALLRREPGPIVPHQRPDDVAPDRVRLPAAVSEKGTGTICPCPA